MPVGGYPLCSRVRVVSFDRPYEFSYNGGQGSGDFLALEYLLVRWAEQHGLDLTYATDLTVIEHPSTLTAHRALLSLGHDECWELQERLAAVAAHRAGVNIAFFGASAVLLNPDAPPGALHVADAAAWIFAGTGLRDGQSVPGVIRSDVDSIDPALEHPPNVQVLAHSPLNARHAQARTHTGDTFYSDMTYYSDPDGQAGVWDSGTNNWIAALEPCDRSQDCPAGIVGAVTANLLRVFGQGPAGQDHPSVATWYRFYPR